MEFIPKAVVVGVLAATPPGAPDRDRLNRVWGELSARQEYRQFNVTSDGAQFLGATADDALLIQPPLIQIRNTARMGIANAADEAQVALRTLARHLNYTQFFNLGIKHVFYASAPNNDARAFLLQLQAHQERLADLERGETVWSGVKYGARAADGSHYITLIEPLLSDNGYLFVDLDVQYPGLTDLDRITDRAAEASEYAQHSISRFLDHAQYPPDS